MANQKTIAREVSVTGIALHTGMRATATFRPAPPNTGVLFVRADLPGRPCVPAKIDNVVDVRRGTTIGLGEVRVHTVEHVMAAASGLGIDNLLVELDEGEPPVGDGSSLPFFNALNEAGVQEQDEPRRVLELRRTVSMSRDGVTMVALPAEEFRISCTISYGTAALDAQYLSLDVNERTFREELAPARTFCFYDEVATLMEKGLIRGGSLDNAVVVRDDAILSKEALRYPDEFVRHKILDMVGDLYLLGGPLKAHVVAIKPGHPPNVELARLLKESIQGRKEIEEASVPVPAGDESLDTQGIMGVLPHRYPFLLVDRMLEVRQDEDRAVGLKNVTINEPFFQGHFPGHPIMPGVLQIEAMAQVGGVLLLGKAGNQRKLAYFMSISNAKFRRAVTPGDRLIIEAEMLKVRGRTGKVKGRITVDGELVSEAELMFALVDAGDR